MVCQNSLKMVNWMIKKIVEELHKDTNAYENGEIIEVRDSLAEIINSIDEFIAVN